MPVRHFACAAPACASCESGQSVRHLMHTCIKLHCGTHQSFAEREPREQCKLSIAAHPLTDQQRDASFTSLISEQSWSFDQSDCRSGSSGVKSSLLSTCSSSTSGQACGTPAPQRQPAVLLCSPARMDLQRDRYTCTSVMSSIYNTPNRQLF